MGGADSPRQTLPTPESRSIFHLGYRPWLDGLRGLAILLVMAYHLGLLPGGSLGVDIFFVLSGFLITALLLEEWQRSGGIRLRNFYLRRALRLLPAFATLLLICGLSSLWLPSTEERWNRWREVAVAACYVANWPDWHQTSMPLLRHTWSLSVEEQFYLLWPLLLLILLRSRLQGQPILLLVGGGILASAVLRMGLYHWYQNHGTDRITTVIRLYMGLDTRADALLVGCLLGLLAAWNRLPRSPRFLRWGGGLSLFCLFCLGYLARHRTLDHAQYYHGLFTAVALMTALVIVRLLAAPLPVVSRILESAPLVAVGRISYGLYLFHMPIEHICVPLWFRWGYWSFVALVLGATLVATLLSYYLIERPCLRWKEHLRSRSADTLPTLPRLLESAAATGSRQAVA